MIHSPQSAIAKSGILRNTRGTSDKYYQGLISYDHTTQQYVGWVRYGRYQKTETVKDYYTGTDIHAAREVINDILYKKRTRRTDKYDGLIGNDTEIPYRQVADYLAITG